MSAPPAIPPTIRIPPSHLPSGVPTITHSARPTNIAIPKAMASRTNPGMLDITPARLRRGPQRILPVMTGITSKGDDPQAAGAVSFPRRTGAGLVAPPGPAQARGSIALLSMKGRESVDRRVLGAGALLRDPGLRHGLAGAGEGRKAPGNSRASKTVPSRQPFSGRRFSVEHRRGPPSRCQTGALKYMGPAKSAGPEQGTRCAPLSCGSNGTSNGVRSGLPLYMHASR